MAAKPGEALAAIRQRDEVQARCIELAQELMKLGEAPAGGRSQAAKGVRQELSDLLVEYSPTAVLEAMRDDAADLLRDPDICDDRKYVEYFAALFAGLDALIKHLSPYPEH